MKLSIIKDIYNWEEEYVTKKGSSLENMLEENVNTHINTSKPDEKWINKFHDILVEQIW